MAMTVEKWNSMNAAQQSAFVLTRASPAQKRVIKANNMWPWDWAEMSTSKMKDS